MFVKEDKEEHQSAWLVKREHKSCTSSSIQKYLVDLDPVVKADEAFKVTCNLLIVEHQGTPPVDFTLDTL